MKNILLTGSEGYIGTNFIDSYNFDDSYKEKFSLILCDKNSNCNVTELVRNDNIDCIIHLAAISGIKQCEEDYDKTVNDNILTINHLANIYPDKHIIFASSQSTKYPTNTYALTKRIGESIIKNSFKNYSILRFANVYGGLNYYDNKTSVVSKFVNAVKNGEYLFVDGNGNQTRDFIHVNDICRAIKLTIEKGPINKSIDIGSGEKVKIIDLAKMISNNIVTNDNNSGTLSNVADTSEAKKLIGFETNIILEYYIKGYMEII